MVGMAAVVLRRPGIHQRCPVLAIEAAFQQVAGAQLLARVHIAPAHCAGQTARLRRHLHDWDALFREVNLNPMHAARFAQIQIQPFAFASPGCPPGLDAFIHRQLGRMPLRKG